MTIKEEIEILRGEPIEVFNGDPMSIPCIEASDAEKLCKHPVVSVHMITYNHEPYIRQAIEGVVMQETDFEFELVIGEDCSQDKTREICFEYQKKYPDKIRVLWWHENVSNLGGNDKRVTSRCRGEYVAFCEGDDYWTDPLKLQKQVDLMSHNPNVGMCFGVSAITEMNGDETTLWDSSAFSPGIMPGMKFFMLNCFGRPDRKWAGAEWFLMTQTVMIRKEILLQAHQRYEIFRWKLAMGDATTWMGVSSISDVGFIPDQMAVYRRTSTGACTSNGLRVIRDATLARLYYSMKVTGLSFAEAIDYWRDSLTISWINHLKVLKYSNQIRTTWGLLRTPNLRRLFGRASGMLPWLLSSVGMLNRSTAYLPLRIIMHFHKNLGWPEPL